MILAFLIHRLYLQHHFVGNFGKLGTTMMALVLKSQFKVFYYLLLYFVLECSASGILLILVVKAYIVWLVGQLILLRLFHEFSWFFWWWLLFRWYRFSYTMQYLQSSASNIVYAWYVLWHSSFWITDGKNYLHVHPMFLHSNATSHKWAFCGKFNLTSFFFMYMLMNSTLCMLCFFPFWQGQYIPFFILVFSHSRSTWQCSWWGNLWMFIFYLSFFFFSCGGEE